VRLHVDAWDPSYGTGLELGETAPMPESSAVLQANVELEPAAWRPLGPAADLRCPDMVLLVDGVRPHRRPDLGRGARRHAAPGAGGLVRGRRGPVRPAPGQRGGLQRPGRRGFFTPSPDAEDIVAASARYPVHRVAGSDPAQLSAAVQPYLSQLEAEVSALARATTETLTADGTADDLLVIDGPLRGRAQLPRALGYVKTHRVQYLPPELTTVVGRLAPGQRCPVFLLGTTWHRYTWYLKLPGPPGSPWAGVVRVECSADLPRHEAIRLADVSAVSLPRFASSPYKDARAPQNLTPIAGLERRLRAMLGDQRLLVRTLHAAAQRRAA
jgi:hypothetical protein